MFLFIHQRKKKHQKKKKKKPYKKKEKKEINNKIHNTKCECKFTCYFRNHINGRVRMLYNKKKSSWSTVLYFKYKITI